jgi:hypothetical protein
MMFWMRVSRRSRLGMTNPAHANPTSPLLEQPTLNRKRQAAPRLTATDQCYSPILPPLSALRLSAGCLAEQPHANLLCDLRTTADLSGTQMGCRSSQAQDLGDISLDHSPPLPEAADAIPEGFHGVSAS